MWKPLTPTQTTKPIQVQVLQAVTFKENMGMIFKVKVRNPFLFDSFQI
jgi:hypothetical protein